MLPSLIRSMAPVVLSLFFFVARAEEPPMAQLDSSCAKSADPAEAPKRFTSLSTKYSGQCIDTDRFRSVQNYRIENQIVTLNNYHHQNEFWQARFSIAAENVDAIYFQIVRFPILGIVEAAHAQIRFKLKMPVELVGQKDSTRVAKASDVLVSFEAARPEGEPYNFALGALKNYALVGRVASTDQKKSEGTAPFEQYELNLNSEERALLLKNTLDRAATIENRLMYNTLRPNCTTEVMDLIDALPRLEGKFLPFLTVISNDPVAQPSIDALKQRKILKNRVQSFEDELQGVSQILEVPSAPNVPLVPRVQSRPWTLVVTLPNLQRLAPSERQAVLRVRKQLLQQGTAILQGIGSAMMKEAGGDTKTLIVKSLAVIQEKLSAVLRGSNEALPRSAESIGLYLVPFEVDQAQTRLDDLGVPAALPFAVVDHVVDDTIARSQEIYYHIAEGARKAADSGSIGQQPAYLMATAILIQLQRNNVQVKSQFMLGLKDQARPFAMQNSQVNFQSSFLRGNDQRQTRPVMLVSHTQVSLDQPEKTIQIEFGPEGGLAGTMAGPAFGTFQIRKEYNGSCELQAASAPTLSGVLADSALGKPMLDKILKGKRVAFRILGAELDTDTLEVKEMNVRVSTWPLNCLATNDVNEQFRQNANQMLLKLKQEAQSGTLVQKLIQGFLN